MEPKIFNDNVSKCSEHIIEVTPSNTADVDTTYGASRSLTIGVAGTLRLELYNGTIVNFSATELAIATMYPIGAVKRVHASGTNADEIKLYV